MSEVERTNRVVVLDRDGTLVIDRGYLDDPSGLAFNAGVEAALRRLHTSGCRLVVITNQSGVGRGFFTERQLAAVHERLGAMVKHAGAQLEAIYYCPHTPDDGCDCRKPSPGLMLQAAKELRFDPKEAVVIGDRASDVALGRAVGATTILLRSAEVSVDEVSCDFVAANLLEAAHIVTQCL